MNSILHLYQISMKSYWRRLFHDFSRELVAAICSIIMLATFYYVFNDFLNVQVRTLSEPMRDNFAGYLSATLLVVATILSGRMLRNLKLSHNTLAPFAKRLGESRTVTSTLQILLSFTILIFPHAAVWSLIISKLIVWQPAVNVAAVIASIIVTLIIVFWPPRKKRFAARPMITRGRLAQSITMGLWRGLQITRRLPTRACLVVAASGLVFLASAKQLPPFGAVAMAWLIGYIASICIHLQVGQDMKQCWIERALGVTHDQFVNAYRLLGLILGGFFGIAAGFLFWLGHGFSPSVSMTVSQVAVICIVPCFTAPLLLFQIDARRPLVMSLTQLIVSLFLATAIFAHWLSLILLPIVYYYGKTTQANLFYRA